MEFLQVENGPLVEYKVFESLMDSWKSEAQKRYEAHGSGGDLPEATTR